MQTVIRLSIKEIEQNWESILDCMVQCHAEENIDDGKAYAEGIALKEAVCQGRAIACGIEKDGRFIGLAWACDFPFRDDSKRVLVKTVYVRPLYRRQGIGTCLLTQLEREAKQRDNSCLFLQLPNSSTEALSFFQGQGYLVERKQFTKKLAPGKEQVDGIVQLDPGQIREYRDSLAELIYLNTKAHFACESATPEEALEEVDDMMEFVTKQKAFVFAKLIDQMLVGFIWLFPRNADGCVQYRVRAVTVLPDHQGKHIASDLVKRAEKAVMERGANDIWVFADAHNTGACTLYEKSSMYVDLVQLSKPV